MRSGFGKILLLFIICGIFFSPTTASCKKRGKNLLKETVLSGTLTEKMLVGNSFKLIGFSKTGGAPIVFNQDGTLDCKTIMLNKWKIDKDKNQLKLYLESNYGQKERAMIFKYREEEMGLVGKASVGLVEGEYVIIENDE